MNTLDEWNKQYSISHNSMKEVGGGNSTNKKNLDRAYKTILNDKVGMSKLQRAYESQGMSSVEAQQAIKTQIQGLVNQYGVHSDHNYAYDNLIAVSLLRQRAARVVIK